MANAWNPSTREMQTNGSLYLIDSQTNLCVKFQANEKTCLKGKTEEAEEAWGPTPEVVIWSLQSYLHTGIRTTHKNIHIHIYTHACVCACACTHKQKASPRSKQTWTFYLHLTSDHSEHGDKMICPSSHWAVNNRCKCEARCPECKFRALSLQGWLPQEGKDSRQT